MSFTSREMEAIPFKQIVGVNHALLVVIEPIVGLVEYSENKNRTNIANIQGGNERIPNIRSLSNCM